MTAIPSPPLAADRAQDAAIAEALGPEWLTITYDGSERRSKSAFSSDPVAFDSLMQEIGKRGLGVAYIVKLSTMANLDKQTNYECFGWSLLSAPQSTKAAAALAVLKESPEIGDER